jgi:hypothetical protein
MILKNYINFININYLVLLLLFVFLISKFFLTVYVRFKFVLFLINLTILSSISIFYNFDGLTMMFLVSELSVILIFIVMFSQLYSYNNENNKESNLFLFVILLLNINFFESSLISYKNYYSYNQILLNDFFYIYNLYFEKQILITLFTVIIITLYSIFFILFYYNLKNKIQNKTLITKNLYLLRKQNIIHQANYNTKIKFFKNK